MIATHIAAFVVGAFAVLVIQQLRIDKIEATHKAAVAAMVQEHATAAKAQQDQATKDQAAITATYEKALNDATTRQAALRADLGAARAAARSLREQASAAARRIHLPETSPAAVAEYAIASSELLAQCAAAYQELGEKADGHAADARTLKAAWPTLEKP